MIKYGLYKALKAMGFVSKKRLKEQNTRYKLSHKKDYKIVARSKYFDADWYLQQNPDVRAAGENPICHYMEHGWKEGRNPSPLFDGNAYLQLNPDVKQANMNPLVHYMQFGKKEGRKVSSYLSKQPLQKTQPVPVERKRDVFFSVIVTSYNYEDFIEETLDSLIGQTYQNFEIIVVDDGSKDNSVQVIKDYMKKCDNIKFFQHPKMENKGLVATIVLALKHAKGEYIAFCESDDYWTKDHLKKINQFIKKTDAAIIVNDVTPFGDDDRLEKLCPVIAHRKQVIQKSNGVIPKHLFRQDNYIITFSACCVNALLLKSCDFNCSRQQSLDWWLWRQICFDNRIFFLDEKLTHFRLHKSFTVENEEKENSSIKIIENFQKDLDEVMKKRSYVSSTQFNLKFNDFDLFGKIENKQRKSTVLKQIEDENFKNVKILYITQTAQINRPILDASSRYRCYHAAEVITNRGGYVNVVSAQNFISNPNYDYDIYVFHRPSTNTIKVINELKKTNKILIADYDDFIFGHRLEAEQSSIYKNKIRTLEDTEKTFKNNLEALFLFDYFTVSTSNLKNAVHRFHPNATVSVVHNFIPDSILRLSERMYLVNTPKMTNTIMYCSGTLSHNKDFPVAEDAILNALDKNPKLQFIVTGILSTEGSLNTHPRIYFHEPVNYWDLFTIMSSAAFNIAPLEMSMFNDCKSNVKFLEASVAGNILIASPIEDMTRVSDAHIILPKDLNEWAYYLNHLDDLYSKQKAIDNFNYIKKNCSGNTFVSEFKNLFKN